MNNKSIIHVFLLLLFNVNYQISFPFVHLTVIHNTFINISILILGSDNEEDENADNKYKEEVRTLVSIVEKLINMTWDKPDNLKVKDLGNMITVTFYAHK